MIEPTPPSGAAGAMARPVVVVPTFNERHNLPALVAVLLRMPDLRIVVVDDASPDGTGEEAERLAREHGGRITAVHRSGPSGLGRSYVDGMRAALRMHATHVLQMDADFSHDPADIPRLVAATASADLAIGSRYVPGGALRDWPAHRIALSAFANGYVRRITRLPVRDCTSGFRCFRAELLAQLPLDRLLSDGYAFQVELAWESRARGATIAEVPITFVERRAGQSKLSSRVIVESAILPWRLAARKLFRRNREARFRVPG